MRRKQSVMLVIAGPSRWVLLFLLAIEPIVGCASVVEPEPEVSSGVPLACTATYISTIGIFDWELTVDADAIEAGKPFTARLSGVETSYTIEKEGYDPLLIPDVVPEDGRTPWWGLATVDRAAQIHESVMSPYPPRGTGTIQIALPPRLAGATLTLRGATGKLAYQDDVPLDNLAELFNLDLTATTSAGRGVFFEVSPGTYQLELGGTANGCVPNYSGWPGDTENSVRVPVRDGYSTLVQVVCSVP